MAAARPGLRVAVTMVAVASYPILVSCTGGNTVGSNTGASGRLSPPAATPLAQAPAEASGDGTTATLKTTKGDIVIELFNRSAPVATENFLNLAEAGFYTNVVFHRIVPGFMIQGGDPTGTGTGGPGYTIRDEPFAGEYTRGTVAMARTPAPNSQGSQFFIIVGDATFLDRTYTIFGRVTAGMEAADSIVNGPRGGPRDDQALEPAHITGVTVQRS
jgi:peptidyl-prolyl cis-trans isomerase B (cyclophilin B)